MNVTNESLFVLDDSFAQALPGLFVQWQPAPVPEPRLVALSDAVAAELGVDPVRLREPDGVAFLSGNWIPDGSNPIAMAYAGHQFGAYSPRLGDGRALLLGEVSNTAGHRIDLHLKGSGRTPFARAGDGKAVLGPMLREFLIAEAMRALGVPTARALAVVTTGERIMREGLRPGAVLTRIASSHLRVGTFQYAARLPEPDVLTKLADYTIERHLPEAVGTAGRYLALLDSVIDAQAELVARWMLLGFIHGVLNTDNTLVSGEGIDYGPCAFMDRYDPATVFSSIDHAGRYAYGNQPAIIHWNLARFAETLIPLVDDDPNASIEALDERLHEFPERYRHHWETGMQAKLGLTAASDDDAALFDDLLATLGENNLDHTGTFRSLSGVPRGSKHGLPLSNSAKGTAWLTRWRARLEDENRDPAEVAAGMDGVNPIYVPRNHLVEEALSAADAGNHGPFGHLLDVVTHPFDERVGLDQFTQPGPEGFTRGFQTFCGT
ncbi:MAG: YdiU family protein [Propionibacteriaceae bacterium]|nr:YdiU family protein [Propionibacteriaceae bacterium]